MVEYSFFNQKISEIKSLEDRGRFQQAQGAYSVLAEDALDETQHAIVRIGRATCHLRMSDPVSAARILNAVETAHLDPTVHAITCNVRASVCHELRDYEQALTQGQSAEQIARTVGTIDLDVLGEALAQQGFAEAERGNLPAAERHLARARRLTVGSSTMRSIHLYTERYGLDPAHDCD